jgi:hypothetical protein
MIISYFPWPGRGAGRWAGVIPKLMRGGEVVLQQEHPINVSFTEQDRATIPYKKIL